jgi:hypothetical protein
MRKLLLVGTHLLALAIGFGLGVYFLPILITPEGPSDSDIRALATDAKFNGTFRRDLPGSDFLHWGEGAVSVGPKVIALMGRVSPGPDYKLYLSPEYVQDKAAFLNVKTQAVRVGDVKTFENFVVPIPESIDLARYNTVVVWCETFSMFITSARYR